MDDLGVGGLLGLLPDGIDLGFYLLGLLGLAAAHVIGDLRL